SRVAAIDLIARRAFRQLTASIDVSDDQSVLAPETDAVPRDARDVRDPDDEGRLVAGLERRQIDRGAAAREELSIAVEEIDDRDDLADRHAVRRILDEARDGEHAVVAPAVLQRKKFERMRTVCRWSR